MGRSPGRADTSTHDAWGRGSERSPSPFQQQKMDKGTRCTSHSVIGEEPRARAPLALLPLPAHRCPKEPNPPIWSESSLCLFSLTISHVFLPQKKEYLTKIPITRLVDAAFPGKGCPKGACVINNPVPRENQIILHHIRYKSNWHHTTDCKYTAAKNCLMGL